MIRKHQTLLNAANFLLDVALIFIAYLLAVWVRLGILAKAPFKMMELLEPHYLLAALAYACALGIVYVMLRLYGSFRFSHGWQEMMTLAVANGIGSLAIGSVLFLFRVTDFSRLVIALFYLFSTGFVIGKRVILRAILEHYRSLGYNYRTLLVVGASEHACAYMRHVQENPQ